MCRFPKVPGELRLTVMDRAMVEVLQQGFSDRPTGARSKGFEPRLVDRCECTPYLHAEGGDRITQLLCRCAVEDVAAVLSCPVIVLPAAMATRCPSTSKMWSTSPASAGASAHGVQARASSGNPPSRAARSRWRSCAVPSIARTTAGRLLDGSYSSTSTSSQGPRKLWALSGHLLDGEVLIRERRGARRAPDAIRGTVPFSCGCRAQLRPPSDRSRRGRRRP